MQPFEPPTPKPTSQPTPQVSKLGLHDGWRRRHPISPVINTIDRGYVLVRQAWPALAVLALRGARVFGIAVAVAVTLLAAWAVLAHLRFQYRLLERELEVRSGVFTHHTRTLPVDRVQQVSMDQKLRHQLFGVVDVGIESAGGGKEAEIHLSVVSKPEAERLRATLTAARQTAGADAPAMVAGGELPPPRVAREPVVLYEQPTGALFKWSLANSPLLMIAVVAPVATTGVDFLEERLSGRFPTGAVGISIVVAVLAALAIVAATAANMVRFHKMRLTQFDDELRLRYGLLTEHQVDIPRERIQVLVEKLSVPGRLAGVVGVIAHNATGAAGGATTYLPAVPRGEHADLTDLLVPGVALRSTIERHPRAALPRSIVRRVIPTLLVSAIVMVSVQNVWSLLVLLLLVPAVGFGWRAWVVLGHGETNDAVVGRSGVWGETTSFVRRDRVQSASMNASWTQRRRGLATLRIDVAQPLGSVTINDMAVDDAQRILRDLTGRT